MQHQQELITRLRQVCQQDERLLAAAHYGSFGRGEADDYSDLDILLYFAGETAAKIDQRAWLAQIGPVALFYLNEFGSSVAIFDNLVRGEFHFDPISALDKLVDFQGKVWFPSLEAAVIVDKTGELAGHLQPLIGPPPTHETAVESAYLFDSFLNWFLFGANLVERGEFGRALEVLSLVHDNLLRMARLEAGQTTRWITPTKNLERDLSPADYRRYQACTAPLEPAAIRGAYQAAWTWGNEMMESQAGRFDLPLPGQLIQDIGQKIGKD